MPTLLGARGKDLHINEKKYRYRKMWILQQKYKMWFCSILPIFILSDIVSIVILIRGDFLYLFQSEVIKCKSSRLIHVFLKIFDVSFLTEKHHQNYWKFLQVNNICLKSDTILLQYTFYQFQYFIITCLHGQNLSTKVSVKKF